MSVGVWSSLANAAGLTRPKKKFHFNVSFILEDLRNCTYVSGLLFAKIRLKTGGSFSVHSERKEVRSHFVSWGQKFQFQCKMYASPSTAELESCICKVSIRKETRGGKSYEKLGYVNINLAEYAGAGERQRKYLLESYNERVHKPDNSILKVKISLRQMSGDSVFKAPRATLWELEDEGIQRDITSGDRPTLCEQHRISSTSTASTFSYVSGSCGQAGSLQDMRKRNSLLAIQEQVRSCSEGSLRSQNNNESSPQEGNRSSSSSQKSSSTPRSEERTPRNQSPKLDNDTVVEKVVTNVTTQPAMSQIGRQPSGEPTTSSGNHSPSRNHRRQQSLLSGHSSISTSAYSTLSERSMDDECNRSRLFLMQPNSRMEMSRIDPQSVVDKLFQDFEQTKRSESDTEEEAGGGGLKIYVDKRFGTVLLEGRDLDRTNTHLEPIHVRQHSTGDSPKPRHQHKRNFSSASVQTSSSRDSNSTLISMTTKHSMTSLR